jgi:hypothetical protein
MWLAIARQPVPDAPYWPGRRWLAAADAVAWPLIVAVLTTHAPLRTGIVGPLVIAVAALAGANRLHRALWANHRYSFTAWRWGKVAAALLVVGGVLKLTLPG